MKLQLDSLLSQLGNPGRFQVGVFLLLCFNYFPITVNHIIMAFFGSTPPHMCINTDYEPVTVETTTASTNKSGFVAVQYGKCQSLYGTPDGRNVTVDCQTNVGGAWRYTKELSESTIVTEWNLVCDSAYLGKLAATVYFCGVMVGGILFGYLADKFGRKPVMLVSLYVPILIGVGTSFVEHYVLFVVLRFFQGIFMQGLQTSSYVMAMELFQPEYRGLAGALIECAWGLTVVLLAGVAYLFQNWRHIQLAISLPSVLAVGYIWLVPESLRWMITKRKVEETKALVAKIAKFNKLPYPTETMDSIVIGMESKEEGVTKQYTCLSLLSTPAIRKRSLVLFYLWFAVAVSYYGLTFKVTSLPGSKYANFAIAASIEMLSYILVVFIIRGFSRRRSLVFFFLLGALSCIAAGAISFSSAGNPNMMKLSTGFAIFGKFGMGGVFSLTFLYSSEVYPTVIRNIGMGSCAFWARFGGVVAPQVLMLGDFTHKSFSVIAFGVLALIGGGLTLLLPETLGRKLPDTVEDVESSDYKEGEELSTEAFTSKDLDNPKV